MIYQIAGCKIDRLMTRLARIARIRISDSVTIYRAEIIMFPLRTGVFLVCASNYIPHCATPERARCIVPLRDVIVITC